MQNTQAQAQVDPAQQALQAQVAQTGLQLQVAEGQAKIRELNSRAGLQEAKTTVEQMRPQMLALETATKGIYQVQADQQKAEFDRRLAMTDRYLQARQIQSREKIVGAQTAASLASERLRARAQVAASHKSAVGKVLGDLGKAHGSVDAARVRATPPMPQPPTPIPAAAATLLS